MKKFFVITLLASWIVNVNGQVTTAMDFTMTDCNSNTHNLFADHLDNNEVVILEFYMTCSTCIAAGQKITSMLTGVNSQYPGMVNFFALPFTNSYTCTTASNFCTANGISAIPFDTGATMAGYYGGFAMPTVVVLAGNQHQVIYNSNYDGAPGDTLRIHGAINTFFTTLGEESLENELQLSVFPNPVSSQLNIHFNLKENANIYMEIVDVTGKLAKTILMSEMSSGLNLLQAEISDLADGIYFLRIDLNGHVIQRKLSVKH